MFNNFKEVYYKVSTISLKIFYILTIRATYFCFDFIFTQKRVEKLVLSKSFKNSEFLEWVETVFNFSRREKLSLKLI